MSLFSTINNDDNKNLTNSFSFGFNNQLKDCTIGFLFNGFYIQEKNGIASYMSIIALPEYSHSSYEELRLADNEKERSEKHAKIKTASIWTFLLSNKEKYVNPLYDSKKVKTILTPNYAYYSYKLWTAYFMRNSEYAE